jgi:hypothetical protein
MTTRNKRATTSAARVKQAKPPPTAGGDMHGEPQRPWEQSSDDLVHSALLLAMLMQVIS